jgi:hypothetical protein
VTATGMPRWAISFADLALLLLGMVVLIQLQSPQSADAAAAAVPAPLLLERSARDLFEAGEARLRPRARAELATLGASLVAGGGRIIVASAGEAEGAARFDRWELAAARGAATARAIASGGLSADRIDMVVPAQDDAARGPQIISIRQR